MKVPILLLTLILVRVAECQDDAAAPPADDAVPAVDTATGDVPGPAASDENQGSLCDPSSKSVHTLLYFPYYFFFRLSQTIYLSLFSHYVLSLQRFPFLCCLPYFMMGLQSGRNIKV